MIKCPTSAKLMRKISSTAYSNNPKHKANTKRSRAENNCSRVDTGAIQHISSVETIEIKEEMCRLMDKAI